MVLDKGVGVGTAAIAIVVACVLGAPSSSSGADAPVCADRSAHTSATIHAPKKVAAGRWYPARYNIRPDRTVTISKVRVFLDSPKTGATVWKNQPVRNRTWKFQLNLKDRRTQFRVEWNETTGSEGEEVTCRNWTGTWTTPWVGVRPLIVLRDTSLGPEWRIRRRKILCSRHRIQVTSQPYLLRVRGANGNLRIRVPDICEGSSKKRGKRSGKWSLEYFDFNSAFSLYYNFGPRDAGSWPFRWSLYRGRTRISHGTFVATVIVG